MYESFIETLPLLTSLEVWVFFVWCLKSCRKQLHWKLLFSQTCCHPQLSERMKVVDVISSKVFGDSQRIIAQVTAGFYDPTILCFFFPHILRCCCANSQSLQGDLADCFYIVESGQVRITIKRSRVSLTQLHYFGERTKTIWNLTAWFFSLLLKDKKRPGGGGGGYCDTLPRPVFRGVGTRHQQAQSCISLCRGKRQMLGYIMQLSDCGNTSFFKSYFFLKASVF